MGLSTVSLLFEAISDTKLCRIETNRIVVHGVKKPLVWCTKSVRPWAFVNVSAQTLTGRPMLAGSNLPRLDPFESIVFAHFFLKARAITITQTQTIIPVHWSLAVRDYRSLQSPCLRPNYHRPYESNQKAFCSNNIDLRRESAESNLEGNLDGKHRFDQ